MYNKVAIILFFFMCMNPLLSHLSGVYAEESIYKFIKKEMNDLNLNDSMDDVREKWGDHAFTPLHVPNQDYYFFYDNPYRCATFTPQGELKAIVIYFPHPIPKETITQQYGLNYRHVYHPVGTYFSYGEFGFLLNRNYKGLAFYIGTEKPEVYFAGPMAPSAFKDYNLPLS